MLDAVELEKRGIPTVMFVTDAFAPAARAQASLRGMPDLAFAVVPHIFGWQTYEEKVETVTRVMGSVVSQLTKPVAGVGRRGEGEGSRA
ncbi:MAG: hypothetical protein HYX92_18125 [Chloroflexi bacterium]|nr:hypothetical protein [Chloroflexota bacterium]